MIIRVSRTELAADASDIGFAVNLWPTSFRYDAVRWVRREVRRDADGDVTVAIYYDNQGRTLRVYND